MAENGRPLRDLVRECLLRPPQPDRLYVLQPGMPEGRQLRKARATHHLDADEALIAVWQWSRVMGAVSARPSSLIFTSKGIGIAEPRLRLKIPYSTFPECSFTYSYTAGGRSGPDASELIIDGPLPWRSPNADQDAELIADDLNRIKAAAAG